MQASFRPAESRRVYLGLVLVLSIFAVAPLFYPGYIQTHHSWPLVWAITAGHPPDALLPYYLARLLPLAPVTAIKLVFGLGWLLGGVGMFLWLEKWWGRAGALVAALVYIYLPHQIAAVYVRGAWGETWFMGLLPWALLALSRTKRWPLTALAWFGLALSQPGLAGWALGFSLILRPRLSSLIGAAAGGLAAVGLYRWLPVAAAAESVRFGDHLLYPFQLFSAYWDFGASRPGWGDGLSFQLGLAPLGLALLSLILWRSNGEKRGDLPPGSPQRFPKVWDAPWRSKCVPNLRGRVLFFLIGAIVPALLSWRLLGFVWQILPQAGLVYPWQLLALSGLSLAGLAGLVPRLEARLTRLPYLGAIIILVILGSYPYLLPRFSRVEPSPPLAMVGRAELALVDYAVTVRINGHTAGLGPRETTLPLAAYGPPRPNDRLLVRAVWLPLQPFQRNWKLFIHLVDAENRTLTQFDGYPETPISTWRPGSLIEESYLLQLPPDIPPGPYRLYVGLYDETTLQRLAVAADPENRIILPVE